MTYITTKISSLSLNVIVTTNIYLLFVKVNNKYIQKKYKTC